jgi:hypothetical protein
MVAVVIVILDVRIIVLKSVKILAQKPVKKVVMRIVKNAPRAAKKAVAAPVPVAAAWLVG